MQDGALVGMEMLADLFCARRDAYVRDSSAHINEPISVELLVDAYTNKFAVSGYTARVSDEGIFTHVGAIDFDKTPPGAPEAVRRTLADAGIPSLMSMSRRGAHLWVVLYACDGTHGSERFGQAPASVVRKALEQGIRATDTTYLAGAEVFPKSSASTWGCGALRLPLMTHPKTGVRYPVVDMKGNKITKLLDVVSAVEYARWPDVWALAQKAPVEYPRGLGAYRKPTNAPHGSVTQLLAQLGVNVAPGHSCRCPFHGDAHASMSVADDDQRAWCKNPECVAHNGGRGVGSIVMAKMMEGR